MVSREHKRTAALHEKLQQLRSITNSHAENDTGIIIHASKYIEELRQKVDRLNQDIVNSPQSSYTQDSPPTVTVETLEKGFLINVYSAKSSQRLLVSVLEAFEELNLTVVQARASCTDNFQLEAISVEGNDDIGGEMVDAEVVRRAVLQAIRNLNTSNTD
ncbi:uncharacterized protein LOC130803125 [Amaranthus tricolor]|uniref:uncharacterized protein LOC130803125 n=1 Tax=Amaranthus tricolor TaxID=29722 RepID=UPI002582C697|nr:uncharacterized protein LOC130803125 [Amaranthus tricolor]